MEVKGVKSLFAVGIGRLNLNSGYSYRTVIRCTTEGTGITIKTQPTGQSNILGQAAGRDNQRVSACSDIHISKGCRWQRKTKKCILLHRCYRHMLGQRWRMVDMGNGQVEGIRNRKGTVLGSDNNTENTHITLCGCARKRTGI